MDKTVTVYSTPNCHFCHQVKEFLKQHNIPYTEHDVAADADKRKEMIEKTGQMGVPVTIIGDEAIVGYNEGKLKELLGLSA